MNESQFKKKVNDEFKKQAGGLVFNISERYHSGIPDTYWAWDSWSCWIEYKVGYNKPSELQKKKIKDLSYQLMDCYIVTSLGDEVVIGWWSDETGEWGSCRTEGIGQAVKYIIEGELRCS
jgi:hypothetical protein